MGLISRVKDWQDKEVLTEEDLDAEFDNITDFIVDATTSAKGLVMLEDSHASTSVAKGACPKNVKEAYDLAATMLTKATFNANSIVKANSDNTPIVLAVAASRLIGRTSSGAIDDLAKAAVHTILNIEDGADVTDATNVDAAGAVMNSNYNANTFLYAVSNDTPVVKTRAEVMSLLSGQATADFALNTHKLTGVVDPTADQEAATKKYVDDNAGSVSDIAYAASWDGVTGTAPSKNTVYDKIETLVTKALFDANTFLYAVSNDTPVVKTRTEVMGLLSGQAGAAFDFADQNLTNVGTVALDGGQIAFPATAVPSAGANTLDDYEEGSWTPDVQFGNAKVGITYALLAGQYTKVGRKVSVTCYIGLLSKGTSVGSAQIYGLPFTVKNDVGAYAPASFRVNKITYANFFQGYGITNSTCIGLEEVTEAGVLTTLTNTNFADDSVLMLSMTYFV